MSVCLGQVTNVKRYCLLRVSADLLSHRPAIELAAVAAEVWRANSMGKDADFVAHLIEIPQLVRDLLRDGNHVSFKATIEARFRRRHHAQRHPALAWNIAQ